MKSAIVLLACVATVAHATGFSSSASAFAGFGAPRPQYRRPPQVFPKPLLPAPAPPAPVPATLPVSSVKYGGYERNANILKYNNEINPDGSYNYYYETDNGIAAQEQGTPRNFGGNPPVIPDVAQGSFSWTSPEGRLVAITYVADENGYQPQGDAIPTPPPVPPQIARALDYIARNARQ